MLFDKIEVAKLLLLPCLNEFRRFGMRLIKMIFMEVFLLLLLLTTDDEAKHATSQSAPSDKLRSYVCLIISRISLIQ